MPKVGGVGQAKAPVASQAVSAVGVKSQKTSEERAKSLRLPVLRKGCLGPEVQKLQRLLNVRISPSPQLALDGDFGPLTFAAVVSYQRGVSITQDGIVGPQTWYRLLKGEQAAALKAAAPIVQAPAATPAKPVVKAVVSPVVKEAIWEWTLERKFREVVSRIPKRFTGQARREFEAMMQAENLALALVFIAGFMLLSGGTAAIVGWIIFGVDATTSLILALQTTYLAATEEELDEAADEFSHVILSVSIAAFFRGIKSIKQKIKTNANSGAPPKPQKPAPAEPAKPKAQPAPKPVPAKTETIELYHGSKDTSTLKNGKLDPNYDGHFYSGNDAGVAKNALKHHQSFDQAPNPGIIKSNMPKAELDALIKSGDVEVRSYKGFDGSLDTKEFVFKTPKAKQAFNNHIAK